MSPETQNELVRLTTELMAAQSAYREADRAVYRAQSLKSETKEVLAQAEWAISSFYAENRP